MNTGLGVPEFTIMLLLAVLWVVPLAVALWAIWTLHRIHVTQDAMRVKLDGIERLLQRTP
jgi:hypothetical protein